MWCNRPVINLLTGGDIVLGTTIMMQPYQYVLIGNK